MTTSKGDTPDPFDSPTYLLATMFAARRSGDAVLERLAARRLAELGINITFTSNLPVPAGRKGVARAR